MKRLVLFIFAWLTGLFFLASGDTVFALDERFAKGPVNIEADSISYDQEDDTYQAKGQVVITFTGGVLWADSVTLAKGNNMAAAEGRVKIKTDSDVLEGDRVDFNLASNTGVVYSGKLFIAKNHFYLQGDKIEKTGDATYKIQEACATTCDGASPDWRLTGRELDVTIDGYGTLKHGKFLVKDIPVLYVPYFLFPAKTTRQTGLLFPYLAYSRDKLGWDMEIPFYLAISQSADATFYQRYMDKRGFKEGAEFRYFLNKDSYGTVYGDYLHDTAKITETMGDVSRDWQSPQNRWSFYFQNYTAFRPDLYMRADIARVSDNWYFRDFASHNYYLDHYSPNAEERFKKISFVADGSLESLDSRLRVVKDWSLYNLTALVRYTDDLASPSNDATLQKYPEITLTGAKQSFFGTPLNIDLSASYSGNYRNEGQKGNLIDLKPVLSLPLDIGGNFLLTPEVEARGTFWERSDNLAAADADKRGQRTAYRLSADLATSVSRDFILAGKSVEKIRHEIKPELVYDYIPHVDQGDLPDFADAMDEKNAVTAALTNTLMAKVKGKNGAISYLEILRFKLAQSFEIREARKDVYGSDGRRPFGDIDMELDAKPFTYFSFSIRNRFDVNSGGWEKANYDLNLSDTRGNSVSVGYRYTRDLLEEINLSLKTVLTKTIDMSYELQRNQLDKKNLRNSLGFNYHRQCWSVGLSFADDANDQTFMLSFSLNGLGSVGGGK
jgi:LPS-assembly protein